MTTYICWYDNGTGWYEGPYVEEHEDYDAAYRANDIGYGAYVSETSENPNYTETKMKNYTDWKREHEKRLGL